MKNTLTIMNKDFKGFIFNPNFYIAAFMCTVVFSWVYPIQLKLFNEMVHTAMYQQGVQAQQLNIHYALFMRHLSYLNLLMILIVPAITMRLLAEERKMRTFDLLLTSPITSLQIVLGKYFAAVGAIAVIVLLSMLYPIMTSFMADISWGPLVIAYVGLLLVGAVYAAMDLFCSSLTESALVAYVMAVIFNISIWFIGIGVEVVDSSTWRAIFEHISLNTHLSSMVEGTVRSSALVFFLSLISLFVFLSERVVESSRWR